MQLNTYLHFRDNCREAFEFYRSVFGRRILVDGDLCRRAGRYAAGS